MISPPLRVLSACSVACEIDSRTDRTLPAASATFTPAGRMLPYALSRAHHSWLSACHDTGVGGVGGSGGGGGGGGSQRGGSRELIAARALSRPDDAFAPGSGAHRQ